MCTRLWFVGLVVVATLARVEVGTAAELAPAQRDKLVWIDQQLQKCVTLYRERKTDDLKKLIGEIETAISGLQTDAADPTVEPILNPFRAARRGAEVVELRSAVRRRRARAGAEEAEAGRPGHGWRELRQ